MFRNAPRAALRAQKHISSSLAPSRTAARRYLTTEPPHKTSRSWKNAGLRWGIAVAGIYYYNTSPVFAEHPQHNLLNPNLDAIDDEHDNQTIDRLLQSSKSKQHKQKSALQSAVETSSEQAAEQTEQNAQDARQDVAQSVAVAEPATEGAAELEAEAEGEGAFNPVTGEINWDCPCLGGMAYGPCGEEFRAAFSCFVYSNEEPKGMECIEKFGAMQDCFRAHPEVYQSELEDDETLDGELAAEKEELQKELAERREQVQNRLHESKQTNSSDAPAEPSKTRSQTPDEYSSDNEAKRGSASQPIKKPTAKETSKDAKPESEQLVPKAAHDAVETNRSSTRSVTRNA